MLSLFSLLTWKWLGPASAEPVQMSRVDSTPSRPCSAASVASAPSAPSASEMSTTLYAISPREVLICGDIAET